MVILVDADGVLENLTSELPALLNEKYGTDVKFEEMREWGFSKIFPELTSGQIAAAEQDEALYDRIRPINGAPDYLKKLIDDGHSIYIVTNTPYEAVPVKIKKVMERFFPFLTWNHFIIASRKQMIKGDVLIDDGIHNLLGGDYRKILFSAPYNLDFDAEANGMIRVSSWEEAYRAIRQIEEEDMIQPLLISEKRPVADVRNHARRLAKMLAEQTVPEITNDCRTLFAFVLRGAMLIYSPFAEKFDNASFVFINTGICTQLTGKDFDTAVIVDTVVDTCNTLIDTKKLLEDTGVSAKHWFAACVCANHSAKIRIAENFDDFFCLVFMENVRTTIDAGEYAVCGNDARTQ